MGRELVVLRGDGAEAVLEEVLAPDEQKLHDRRDIRTDVGVSHETQVINLITETASSINDSGQLA
ncbi:hypothetical protein OG558_40520 [Kribbella sp. NBC_01510]|uniref:hypothetical protein n=1 Tax=Kribbella sp. NBC_01510 TaxID=2903581 RepID=UPI00386D7D77